MTVALLLALSLSQATPTQDPVVLVRETQREVDRDGVSAVERRWHADRSPDRTDARALLLAATFARLRYQYERADSLYAQLQANASVPREWAAAARLGMAQWRALGSEPARADSFLVAVRAEAQSQRWTLLQAEATLGLAQLRQRSQGPAAGRRLLAEWWGLLPSRSPQDSALFLCQGGALDEQTGDTTGIRRIGAGISLAERTSSWRVAGSCRLLEAQSAERRGYFSGAGGSARQAIGHFQRIHYDPGVALAGQWYGYVEVAAGRYASGEALLQQAVRAAKVTRFESVEAWARTGLAELHLALGDLGEARAQAELAAASHQRRSDRWGMATALGFEARARESSGDLPGARLRYGEAVRAFRDAGLPLNALPLLAERAAIEMRLGMLDSAQRSIAEADSAGRSSEGWRRERVLLIADLAFRRGRVAVADSVLRRSRGDYRWRSGVYTLANVTFAALEAHVALAQVDRARADSAVTAMLAALDEWRGRLKNAGITPALVQLRTQRGRLSDGIPALVAQLASAGAVPRAFDLIEHVRARELIARRLVQVAQQERPGVTTPWSPKDAPTIASLPVLQSALGTHEGVVMYTLGLDGGASTALVVTRDTTWSAALPSRDALVGDIERLTRLAAAGVDPEEASRRLGGALLGPVFGGLPDRVTRIMISADGELHRLPFDALRLPNGRHALERATISMIPSATLLLALRALPPMRGTEVVAIGDADYVRRGRSKDSLQLREAFDDVQLARLPYARAEATRVAEYGTRRRLLLGAAAGERAIREGDWRDAAVLHFATHALVDADRPTRTALALSADRTSDGFATPAELAELRLSSPLVVLSACHSIGGQVLGGEGLRGLTAPFLEAGARAVVATHWSIGDRSVVPFIERFYDAMARGAPADEALRLAKLAALRDNISIADWGAFEIIGDGAARPPLRTLRRAPTPWLRDPRQPWRDTTGR